MFIYLDLLGATGRFKIGAVARAATRPATAPTTLPAADAP
jgi:hypothetical protein